MTDKQIVRIARRNATASDPITIIGAHIDSLSRYDPFARAPGADDDGSGTVTILEACRGPDLSSILRSPSIC